MESQPQNPEFMNNPEYFHPHNFSHYLMVVIRIDFPLVTVPSKFRSRPTSNDRVEADHIAFADFDVIRYFLEDGFQWLLKYTTDILWLFVFGIVPGKTYKICYKTVPFYPLILMRIWGGGGVGVGVYHSTTII